MSYFIDGTGIGTASIPIPRVGVPAPPITQDLRLFLDAQRHPVVADDSQVTPVDYSGQSTISVAGTKPRYDVDAHAAGQPAFRFPEDTWLLAALDDLLDPITAFIRVKRNTDVDNSGAMSVVIDTDINDFDIDKGFTVFQPGSEPEEWNLYSNGVISEVAQTTGAWHTLVVTRHQDQGQVRVNTTLGTGPNPLPGPLDANRIIVGARWVGGGPSNFIDGWIRRVLVYYQTEMTEQEISDTLSWMAGP